jgi:hypothetical protein
MSDSLSIITSDEDNTSISQPRRRRRSPLILIRATANLPEQFQEIVAIDDIDYLTQAIGLTALFNGAIDNQTGRFEPARARALIESFNNDLPPAEAKYKIGIFNVHQSTLTQSNALVSAMVDKVLEAVKSAVGVALGTTTVDQLTKSITEAFTDLKSQEGDAWIFWQKKTANKTTYSYAILFAIQDATTGRLMFALPMSMEIEVDVAFEKVLWITVQDKESYSVKLDLMKVGQLLYPKSPASSLIRDTVERAAIIAGPRPEDGPETLEATITNVEVTNWAQSQTYATAPSGHYTRNLPLEQLITAQAVVTSQMFEGTRYRVAFTLNGQRTVRSMLFNGEVGVGGGALWFVTQ